MDFFQHLIQFILHIDQFIIHFIAQYGVWTYLLIFIIIFSETGLVITPFLPGDSLLFTLGSLTAQPETKLNVLIMGLVLILASILGNLCNYLVGQYTGPKIFNREKSRLINKKYLYEAQAFYKKHGGKTIIMARFIPIIRTFAPFVAGISQMKIVTFNFYNILSAFLWIESLLLSGYFLGQFDYIKNNLSLVIYIIIVLSLLPGIFSLIHQKLST